MPIFLYRRRFSKKSSSISAASSMAEEKRNWIQRVASSSYHSIKSKQGSSSSSSSSSITSQPKSCTNKKINEPIADKLAATLSQLNASTCDDLKEWMIGFMVQWLWCIWQSSRLIRRRSADRIPQLDCDSCEEPLIKRQLNYKLRNITSIFQLVFK